MKKDFDAYFDVLADQGDKDYMKFYDRVKNHPEEAVYKDIADGIKKLKEEKVVLHITDMILYYYFVDNPTVSGMHIFAKGRPMMKGPLITKNSPLG